MRRFRNISQLMRAPAASGKSSLLQAVRQRHGEAAEKATKIALDQRGYVLVEKVEVPFRMDASGRLSARKKVSGDFRGVDPRDGRSVLVEVKHHDDRLSWAAFKRRDGSHQSEELDAHLAAHGITEVAWMDRGTLRLIPWERFRAIGYGPGKSVVWTGSDITIHTPRRGKRAA